MNGFKDDVTLRFGALDLVRGEWRRYANSLDANDPYDPNLPNNEPTGFDVWLLMFRKMVTRTPIPYVSPPGVRREQLYNNNAVINQNEQALIFKGISCACKRCRWRT